MWCIYEILRTKLANNPLEVLLPKEEKRRFLEALEVTSAAAKDAFAKVNVVNSEAHDPADKERIMGEVDAIGDVKVNRLVIGALNDSVANAAVRAVQESDLASSELPLSVALLLRDLERLEEGRALAERVVAAREAAEGVGNGEAAATLDARGVVGNIMKMQGELEGAQATLEEAVATLEEVVAGLRITTTI